ncbi:MAG: hypothetical protein Kow0069_38730 [Promethearchaeota archaeon]
MYYQCEKCGTYAIPRVVKFIPRILSCRICGFQAPEVSFVHEDSDRAGASDAPPGEAPPSVGVPGAPAGETSGTPSPGTGEVAQVRPLAKNAAEARELLTPPPTPEAPPLQRTGRLSPPKLTAKFYSNEGGREKGDPVVSVVSDCATCGTNVVVPVPRQVVESSDLPVVPVAFVHGTPKHALVLHVDRDFQVRRRRTAAVVEERPAQ